MSAIAVFNLLGQQVYQTIRNYTAGVHSYSFTSADASTDMASGVYFLQVQHENQLDTQKIILMK